MENSVINLFVNQNMHIQWHTLHVELMHSGASFEQIEQAFKLWLVVSTYPDKMRGYHQYLNLRHADLLRFVKSIIC